MRGCEQGPGVRKGQAGLTQLLSSFGYPLAMAASSFTVSAVVLLARGRPGSKATRVTPGRRSRRPPTSRLDGCMPEEGDKLLTGEFGSLPWRHPSDVEKVHSELKGGTLQIR